MQNTSMTYGTEKALTENAFTRTGYTFIGWSEDENATEETYGDKERVNNLTTTHNATVTLYAVWQANEITLNDGSKTLTFSTSSQNFTIEGASNGTGSYTYSEVSEINGDSESTSYITISGTTITVAANAPAGTYTYVIRATDNGSGKTDEATITITINTASISTSVEDSALNKIVDYTGTAISPNTVTVTTPSTGATVKYGTTNGTYNLDAPQTYTDAGTYTIYYQITAPNYTTKTGSYTLTINKIEPTHNVTGNTDLTYNGNPQELGEVTTNGGAVTLTASAVAANYGEYNGSTWVKGYTTLALATAGATSVFADTTEKSSVHCLK